MPALQVQVVLMITLFIFVLVTTLLMVMLPVGQEYRPGPDGTIVVRAQPHTSVFEAYAFAVFMLQEEAATGPTITTTWHTECFQQSAGGAFNRTDLHDIRQ